MCNEFLNFVGFTTLVLLGSGLIYYFCFYWVHVVKLVDKYIKTDHSTSRNYAENFVPRVEFEVRVRKLEKKLKKRRESK